MLDRFHILTVSHKEVALDELPNYALLGSDTSSIKLALSDLKERLGLDELFYLNTCNRILYLLVTKDLDEDQFVRSIFPSRQVDGRKIQHLQGEEAIQYLFQVASSIHSLVVGEREILKQIRDAYDQQCADLLTGDLIRLAIQQTIRTAKQVYAQTKIGERPVSVVSLAVQKLLTSFELKQNAKFLVVGAGSTVQLLLKHMTKKGYQNFSIYNRSAEKAANLMVGLNGKHGDLKELEHHNDSFDCLIACTGSQEPIISFELAKNLADGKLDDKIWLDLGVPPDVSEEIQAAFPDRFIGMQSLKNWQRPTCSCVW